MIDVIARKVIPDKIRGKVGLWALKTASSNVSLLRAYTRLAHGYDAKNFRLIANEAFYNYNGIEIALPKDGIGSCFEVFNECVYDRYYQAKSGDIVVDVGAYVGMFTVKCNKAKLVIACEPAPANYGYLVDNTKLMDNVKTVYKAIGDKVGLGHLQLAKLSSCHSMSDSYLSGSTMVPVDTLDNLVPKYTDKYVDLLKVDAEGYEVKVLEGAKGILKTTRNVAVAIYHTRDRANVPVVIELLGKAGFTVEMNVGLRSYIYGKRY